MKKTRLMICLTALGAAGVLAAPQARAGISFSFSAGAHINSVADFHAPLADLGAWVSVGSYGQCWRPNGVAADWRPYSNGSWVSTDAGWYWQSDEAWAPECYHYGSWVDDSSDGWVWVPGTQWAPAWVTWRDSDNYIGWAPCGPNQSVAPDAQFCFVDVHHFADPIRRDNIIINNRTILNRTRVVKDFRQESHDINGVKSTIMANRGPDVKTIQRATGRTFAARPIGQVVQNNRRAEPAARQPDRTRAQAQPQTDHRIINEPAGAQTPTAPRRDEPAVDQRSQTERLNQEKTAQHATMPDAAVSRATQPPAIPQRQVRSAAPTPRPAERAPAQTIREPAGAERVAPERETARPAERPTENRQVAKPVQAAPRREAAPAKSAPPQEEKKQPQS